MTLSRSKFTTSDIYYPKKHITSIRKIKCSKIHAIHSRFQRAQMVLRTHRQLQKPHQSLCQHHSYSDTPPKKGCTIQLDRITSKRAFTELKRCLQRPPLLFYPVLSKPYYLFTDASKYCWRITLFQYMSESV